jgi:phenylalanyl-tRNA synthetase beta chain
MRVPLSWLRDFVNISLPTTELAERLTLAGLAVDAIEQVGDWWDTETIVVGEVIAVRPHPDADRLTIVDVQTSPDLVETVVTGAPNLFVYKGCSKATGTLPACKVAFARTGAVLVDAYSEERPRPKKKLKSSKIRGVMSGGMVCSERELGLSEEHEGIMILPEDAPVGLPLRDYLGDEILVLDLTTDMARCLSMIGVAREAAALTGEALYLPAHQASIADILPAQQRFAVEIDDPDLCNRYTGLIIENVTIAPSPLWMQQRLIKAGMRPINNVVDITNYVMIEWGQPLHAFDYDILQRRAATIGQQTPVIIVRRAQAGEKFTTLDNIERTLDERTLMICDRAGSVAIAGVMGGLESEVTDATKTILLESATFDGFNNRRTSNRLVLYSEASKRFTRGVPATLNSIAVAYAAELMRRYAGGSVAPGIVDAYPVQQQLPVVYTSASDMQRILGVPLTLQQIADALRKLDFSVAVVGQPPADAAPEALFALYRDPDEPLLACVAPWHRLDVRIPADLCEEVARVVGYEHVGTTLIADEMPVQRRRPVLETETKLYNILTAAGLQETVNYTLTTPENHHKLITSGAVPRPESDYIVLANPGVPERRVMRRSMIVSALENLASNLRYSNRLTVFEIGRVYLPEGGNGDLPFEERRVCILLAGARQAASFYHTGQQDEFDFFDCKGLVETMLDRLGFRSEAVEFRAQPDSESFGPRCAGVYVNNRCVGVVGELHPKVRAAYTLPNMRVCIADLSIEALVRPAWSFEPMQPISAYMPVIEDLAFDLSEEHTVRRVEEIIRRAGGALLVAVELFDVYRSENVGLGRKSLAFHLTYQSNERNLNEKEVTKLRNSIIAAVERETGGKLRV